MTPVTPLTPGARKLGLDFEGGSRSSASFWLPKDVKALKFRGEMREANRLENNEAHVRAYVPMLKGAPDVADPM